MSPLESGRGNATVAFHFGQLLFNTRRENGFPDINPQRSIAGKDAPESAHGENQGMRQAT
jgi:hypothetical protein